MFSPHLKTCFQCVKRHVYIVFEEMFTLCLKTYYHYVYTMFKDIYIYTIFRGLFSSCLKIHSICICMFVLSLNIFFHYVLTLSLNICFHYVCLKMFLYPIQGHFYTIFKYLFLPCLKAMFTQFWIKDQNIFSEAYYLLDFLTKQNF